MNRKTNSRFLPPDKLTEEDIKILKTMAECDLNITEAARRMYFTRVSFVYRLNRIEKITGFNPTTFWGLVRILNKMCYDKKCNILPENT